METFQLSQKTAPLHLTKKVILKYEKRRKRLEEFFFVDEFIPNLVSPQLNLQAIHKLATSTSKGEGVNQMSTITHTVGELKDLTNRTFME